ncbi:O-antigen ligase family protein [Thiopseudomonas alkaliphila]|uniref:O-antigen ligase family protein n=1 Tax=Thiopseudomonas alkaliphila TaxID=1697053 RepID=UPI002574A5B8|nr:O-antigen ligase family protein [Thiopseudomonas alkaliphila]MDM1707271.1 O-antigen ligase family protein [Thiopseudomonas alkaliphila]
MSSRRETGRLERALVAGLLLLLLWLPLPLGSNRPWAMALLIALVGLLALGWALGVLSQRIALPRALRAALPLFALLLLVQLWAVLQYTLFGSADTGRSALYIALGLAYSLLFLLIVGLFAERQRLNWLLAVLVVSGTLQAFYGAFMALSGVEWSLLGIPQVSKGVATGTFVNRNHFAGYLELALGCGIGLLMALRSNERFSWANFIELIMGPKARLRLALVIMVIALVMSRSRGGNSAFFIALLAVGALFVIRTKQNRKRNILILLSIILIDTLVVSQYFGLERLKDRIVSTRLVDQVATNSRGEVEVIQQANEIRGQVFLDALPLAQDKLLLGQGAGSFESVFSQYSSAAVRLHFDHLHNDYLQFVIEYGAVATGLLALFVLGCLWFGLRALWQSRSEYRAGLALGVCMGLVSLLIHSLSDFNLQIPANAATFVVLCALAVLAKEHSHRRQLKSRE